MLMHQGFVIGHIDAEHPVRCHIAVFPLDVLLLRLHGGEHGIGLVSCVAQRLTLRRPRRESVRLLVIGTWGMATMPLQNAVKLPILAISCVTACRLCSYTLAQSRDVVTVLSRVERTRYMPGKSI